MFEKNITNIGFIGSGDWGSFFFNQLGGNEEFKITHILTSNNQPLKHKEKSFNSTSIFYSSKEDYKQFFNTELKAIIVAGWQYKIPDWFINEINCPIFNIHASLLPLYRGPEPLIQQILNHEVEGGVTIHKIDKDWDNGDIYEQINFMIDKDDNNKKLFIKAALAGKRILTEFLIKLKNGLIQSLKQDASRATYFSKINYLDYMIDESKSIDYIITLCKAFNGTYPITCNYNNVPIIINSFYITQTILPGKASVKIKDGYLILNEFVPLEEFNRMNNV